MKKSRNFPTIQILIRPFRSDRETWHSRAEQTRSAKTTNRLHEAARGRLQTRGLRSPVQEIVGHTTVAAAIKASEQRHMQMVALS